MKTIFTLGPASDNESLLRFFCKTATGFRLNVAHLTPVKLQEWLDKLTLLFTGMQPLPVVLDLQGAKMRVGKYPALNQLPSPVTLFLGTESTEPSRIPIPHAPLFQALRRGDRLLLNDARVQLEVTETSNHFAKAVVVTNGPLSANKGINRALHPLPFTEVIASDQDAIAIGLKYPFVQFACSFVLDGHEMDYLRPLTADRVLIAKIERPEAMSHLIAIDKRFQGLWFCRGDLGAQAGLKQLAPLQKEFAAAFPRLTQSKWLAGQVLEYMTHFPEPTRSEVVHLAEARAAGFDGIVLSDETAIGKYPYQVASFLADFWS